VVADQVGARRRDERDEAHHELPRFEEDRGGPVAPAMAEAVEQAAIGEPREAFEPAAVAGRNRDVGVEGEARGRGAAGRAGAGEFIGIDAVASPGGAATLAVETTNGGGSQAREAGLVRGQWIGYGRVGLGTEPEMIEKPVDPERDLLDDAPDLVIVGRRKGTKAHPGHAVVLWK